METEPPLRVTAPTTTSKLNNISTSIFSKMGKMASTHKAINLAQGYPDFKAFDHLLDKAKTYIDKGYNQYAPVAGIPALRSGIQQLVKNKYKTFYHDETEITVTSGALQSLYVAITAFIKQGDEVIIFEPAFDSYAPVVQLNGGIVKPVQLYAPDFKIDWEVVKKKINRKTKMIILNYPNNPTGTLLSKNDLEQLKKLTRDTDIIILSDEVYEHILLDNKKHVSIASDEELARRSMVISSLGKTFHVTGWRLGYCLAPQKLTEEFRKIHQFMLFSVNTPMQYAIADIINDEKQYEFIAKTYTEKKDYFLSLIKHSRLKPLAAQGTFFMLLNYEAISNENDVAFTERLVTEFGVAAIPCSAFYSKPFHEKLIRICFAKDHETLRVAAEKLLLL